MTSLTIKAKCEQFYINSLILTYLLIFLQADFISLPDVKYPAAPTARVLIHVTGLRG